MSPIGSVVHCGILSHAEPLEEDEEDYEEEDEDELISVICVW